MLVIMMVPRQINYGDVPPLVDMISAIGGMSFLLKGVLLTHVHYDHIYGLLKLMPEG